jgi:hypothetical protein
MCDFRVIKKLFLIEKFYCVKAVILKVSGFRCQGEELLNTETV